LHDISLARTLGASPKSPEMFGKLCGDEAIANVTLATTKWSKVDRAEGESREETLKETYWNKMLDRGATMARFHDKKESAWAIVDQIINKVPIDETPAPKVLGMTSEDGTGKLSL
jgi:hypothetical protein